MVVHNSNSIAMELPAMSILSQLSFLAAIFTPIFKALEWFSSIFQSRAHFQGLYKKAFYIQVLLNPVQTIIYCKSKPVQKSCLTLSPVENFSWFFVICWICGKNSIRNTISMCQIVWIQIRPDILSGLIWVQTVCKSYQQTALGDKELNK